MAESKVNFLKGRMQKDLDERVVPNGEYRDALNVQINTSEGSDVGAVQNLFGNENVFGYNKEGQRVENVAAGQTVGSIVDNAANCMYMLIADCARPTTYNPFGNLGIVDISNSFDNNDINPFDALNNPVNTDMTPNGSVYFGKGIDEIVKISPDDVRDQVLTECVLRDVYRVATGFWFCSSSLNQLLVYDASCVRVGMEVTVVDRNGIPHWTSGNDKILVTNVFQEYDPATNTYPFVTLSHNCPKNINPSDIIANGYTVVFDAPKRVLNFKTSEVLTNSLDENNFASPTPTPSNLITGINILESKFLMFTDGFNEPKKINIQRCLEGTDQTLNSQKHTDLLVTNKEFGQLMSVCPIEESHITVIKPAPKHKLHTILKSSDALEEYDFTEAYKWQAGGVRMMCVPPGERQDIINHLLQNGYTSDEVADYFAQVLSNNFSSGMNSSVGNSPNPQPNGTGRKYLNLIRLSELRTQWILTAGAAPGGSGYAGPELVFPAVFGFNGFGTSTPNSDGFSIFGGNDQINNTTLQNIYNFSAAPVPPHVKHDDTSYLTNFGQQMTDGYDSFNPDADATPVGFTQDEIQGIFRSRQQYDLVGNQLVNNQTSSQFPYSFRSPTDNYDQQYYRSYFLCQPGVDGSPFNNDTSNYFATNNNLNQTDYNNLYPQDLFDVNLGEFGNNGYNPPNFSAYPFTGYPQANSLSPLSDWADGDVFTFRDPLAPGNSFTVKLHPFSTPTDWADNSDGVAGFSAALTVGFIILDITIDDDNAAGEYRRFYGFAEDGNGINRDDFFRLSYRYEYEDGEVSPIGPWTPPLFKGRALLLDRSGNNEGMYNTIASVEVKDFVSTSTPKDVVGVDILYKRDNDQNIYEILKCNNGSIEWNRAGSSAGLNGFAKINKEYFGRVLDPNQKLRIFDNVPKKAVAQEIIGNRLVYGNYTEGFEMLDHSGKIIEPDIKVSTVKVAAVDFTRPELSVKASRTYSVGIVYIDEFGREAPVVTSNDAVYTTSKTEGLHAMRLQVEIRNFAPYWAHSYKIFVKEPSFIHSNIGVVGALYDDIDGTNEITILCGAGEQDKVQINDELIFLNGPNQKRYRVINKSVGTPIGQYSDTSTYGGQATTQQAFDKGAYMYLIIAGDGSLESQLGIDGSFGLYGSNGPTAANFDVNAFKQSRKSFHFEVVPKNDSDLDLWWEASEAIPVYINDKNVKDFIKEQQEVSYRISPTKNNFTNQDLQKNLQPGIQVFTSSVSAKPTINIDDDVVVSLNQPSQQVILGAYQTQLGFKNKDSKSTFRLRLKNQINAGDTEAVLYNQTHPTPNNPTATSVIDLYWVNCVSQSEHLPLQTSRMKGSLSGNVLQKGIKASTILQNTEENHKSSGFIWSGLYNSGSQVNELNQFNAGLPITKDLSPRFGSIQKLYAKDTNLTAFCEDKVLNILANKDALFNADGSTNITASNAVLGQATPYVGEYGISLNPESFAVYGHRQYFVDKARGVVLRLSRNGLTTISETGMRDFFLDNTQNASSIIGSYDERKQEYNVTINSPSESSKEAITVSFSEYTVGWSSFKSFIPEAQSLSLNSEYYTFMNGNIYKHHKEKDSFGNNISCNNFYNNQYKSTITCIINQLPSVSKEFKTLNYSGDLGWAVVEDILTDIEDGHVGNSFKNINNKHYDYIKGGKNPSSPTSPPNWTNAGSPFSGSIHAVGQIDFSGKNVFGVGSINSTFLKEGDTALQTNKVQFFIKSDNSETSLAAQSNTLGVGIYAPSGSSSGILVSNSYSGNL